MFARTLLVAIVALSITSPVFGQSKATCAEYMTADATYSAIPEIQDMNLLFEIEMATQNPKRKAALGRLLKLIARSPMISLYNRYRLDAYRRAYRGPVVENKRAMYDLVMADRNRCRERIGLENWPNPRNVKGKIP